MIGAGLRVLVVGAGIGGLGAARALRRRGFAADVIEREPAWTHTGAGIYLPGNASRALHALGLESALAERASPISHQRLCDHRARLLADIDLAALWDDVGPCLALHRADLHEVLAFHGDPVPIRMGISLQGLSQQDSTVTVEFDDGSAGRYDLVIGADGIHSTVRQLTVGADAVRPVGQVAWRFVTECPPEVTTWTVLLGRGVTFLAVPIGRGQVYCYCDAPASSSPRPDHDVTGRLAELLAGLRRHPIWPKALRWPSRTAWSSPSALPPGAASLRRWRPSRLGAAHVRNGSLPRRTTGTAPATCHPLCATWCCAYGDATSSTPTTVHSSISRDGGAMRCAWLTCWPGNRGP
jgi:2-polyprenyl-6-methoxyphenol hydroxylase-like FAD-dependent oxidoreductase